MHFLIADAIPRAVERKCGRAISSRPSTFSVEVFRAREIAHGDGDVMKGFKLQHSFTFTFYFDSAAAYHL